LIDFSKHCQGKILGEIINVGNFAINNIVFENPREAGFGII